MAGLGFVAAPRGAVGDAADRGVAGMYAIAFARDFPPPPAKNRGKKCELLERLDLLILAVSSLISDFPKGISVPNYPKSILELSSSHPTRGACHDRQRRGMGCGGRGSVRRATWLQGGSCKWPVSDQTAR